VVVSAFNYVMETYGHISISNELSRIGAQSNGTTYFEDGLVKRTTPIFQHALRDVNRAIEDGMIQNFDIDQISQVMNLVMYGGDGNEPELIVAAAKMVIQNYSTDTAKSRLIFNEARRKQDISGLNQTKATEDNNNQENCNEENCNSGG
jgi:hypothetical protein